MTASLTISLVFLGCVAAATSVSAIEITQVAGKFECPELSNQAECAMKFEKEFLAKHPGLVFRQKSGIKIKLRNGRYLIMPDKGYGLSAVELQGGGRFLAVREQFYEGNTWHIVDLDTGAVVDTGGYSLFSPDNSRFVAAAEDLDAGYSSNVFDVYQVKAGGVSRVFKSDADATGHIWAARHVRWKDNYTISFSRTTPERNDLRERPSELRFRNAAWFISPLKYKE